MANIIKTQEDILAKLQIEALNPMQIEAVAVIKIESPIAKKWIENEKALIRARNPSGKINKGFFARIFK